MKIFERLFKLRENGTTVRTEILAGVTTFLAMAYIMFVQPAVLSGTMFGKSTGMDFGAVMTATCLSAAMATAIMAIYARYPIAQAPGMGENFFFVFSVIPAAAAAGFPKPWAVALGVVFISGVLFLLLSLTALRELIFNAISPSLKSAVAAGIGLFIAFIGLQNAGVIIKDPGTAVRMNPHLLSPDLGIFFLGLLVTAILRARQVRGALLAGMAVSTISAILLKVGFSHGSDTMSSVVSESALVRQFSIAHRIVAAPPSISPTFLSMDLAHAVSPKMFPFILVFLFMLMFDAIGTLIGVAEQAGFIRDNKLPRARQAMLSDAIGTVAGAALGTSTVTSFIESAAGVAQGGRTGLTGLVVALCFVAALFFEPIARMIGSYPPITAPVLVIVGAMMFKHITNIQWMDFTEAFPAFLILVGIPLSYSIADGLALGLITYPVLKVCAGKGRELGWLTYVMAVLLVAYFVFIRSRLE